LKINEGEIFNIIKSTRNYSLKIDTTSGRTFGRHQSVYEGHSREYRDRRRYLPGAEIKDIDWKAFARTEKLFVKIFEGEHNLNIYFFLDFSKSMTFTTTKLSKIKYAALLALSIAYIASTRNENISMIIYSNKLISYVPLATGRRQFASLLHQVNTAPTGGNTSIYQTISEIVPKLQNKSISIILSDMLDDYDGFENAIRVLRGIEHKIYVFNILDPCEIEPTLVGDILMRDLESDKSIPIRLSDTVKAEYKRKFNEYFDKVRDFAISNNITYEQLSTNTTFESILLKYFYGI